MPAPSTGNDACMRSGRLREAWTAETAARLGVSRVSARRYLEHLVDTRKAEVRLRYGEVGRPERRYQWR